MSEMVDLVIVALRTFRSATIEIQAIEAIKAIREPTEDVAEIMSRHASNGMVDWRDLHKAFIDASLT